MTVVFLGIDLAKNVFALHGVDAAGKPCLVRPQVRRDQLACIIGMEECSSSRQFAGFGHTVHVRSPLEESIRNPAAGFDVDAAVVVVAAAASIAIARFFVYGCGGGRGSSPSRG